MPEIITRAEAKERGLKRYFTGLCFNRHLSERWTRNARCIKCHAEANARKRSEKIYCMGMSYRDYRRWYTKTNGEKINEARRLRLLRDPSALAGKSKADRDWKRKNRKKLNEYRRNWAKKNPGKQPEYDRRYRSNGPQTPKGEMQWLRKNQAQLRALRRALKASRSQSEASTPAPSSQA